MFEWIGKQAMSGALKNLPGGIVGMVEKLPIARWIPHIVKYWENLSDEDKDKYTAIMFKAAMKALESYAK